MNLSIHICLFLSSDVASHLECEQAEESRRSTGDQQPDEEPDHGEVFDIPINDPLGDEFQVSPLSISSDNIVFVCVCVCVSVCVLVGQCFGISSPGAL